MAVISATQDKRKSDDKPQDERKIKPGDASPLEGLLGPNGMDVLHTVNNVMTLELCHKVMNSYGNLSPALTEAVRHFKDRKNIHDTDEIGSIKNLGKKYDGDGVQDEPRKSVLEEILEDEIEAPQKKGIVKAKPVPAKVAAHHEVGKTAHHGAMHKTASHTSKGPAHTTPSAPKAPAPPTAKGH